VWVSGGSGRLKNTREDMAMYPGFGYWSPTSSSVVICIREHPNQGVTTKKKEIWQGTARCYPKLVGGEVGFPGEGEERSALSSDCCGEERSVVPLRLLYLWAELGMSCSILF